MSARLNWFLCLVPALILLVSAVPDGLFAQVHVRGYIRRDGTYVAPHFRSSPDGNPYNNWSAAGNTNPFTGTFGTRTIPPPNYGQDVNVHGYVRSNGIYVPPHMRSAPDGDPYNNWGATGNINPYTGVVGTRSSRSFDSVAGIARARKSIGISESGLDNAMPQGISPSATPVPATFVPNALSEFWQSLKPYVPKRAVTATRASPMRKWRSSDLRHETDAVFMGKVGETVRLRKIDGATIIVAWNSLSGFDQAWILDQK